MNALAKAMTEIKFTIPLEVLQVGFIENYSRINHVVNLDERILNSVIRARVMVDANLYGGVTVNIPLEDCNCLQLENREWVIEVPKSITQGKSIVNVLSLVSYANFTGSYYSMGNRSSFVNGAEKIYNHLADHNVIQTARLELIGDNTILVQDPSVTVYSAVIRCNLEYSKDMGELHPRYYNSFSKLCVLAVKSYIYNHCKVKLDQAYAYSGHELGTITEIIDGYSDAEEMYQEHLKTEFMKIAFMNHAENNSRMIKIATTGIF